VGGAGTPDPVSDLAREISETVEYQLAAALTLEPSPEAPGTGASDDETEDDGAGGDSPYRTETPDLDVFWNPYLPPEPYGTIQFTTDSDDADAATGEAAGSTGGDIADDGGYAAGPVAQSGAAESGGGAAVPSTPPAEIRLTLSNATPAGTLQDRTDSFDLPDLGPNSISTVFGSQMEISGVSADAEVGVARDGDGNVDVELLTAWNSIKNIYAVSDRAADISIANFVHADLEFGNGGDSHISLDAVKRGFIVTGDGDDVVEIRALSNGGSFSKRVEVDTSAGDDTVIYRGSSDGLSELTFRGGSGTDTLQLQGPWQTFDLSTGQYDLIGVERIDLSDTPDVTLMLGANIVPKLKDSGVNALTGTEDTLVVSVATVDQIELANGAAWTTADTEIDGESYTIYEHSSGVRVVADQDIAHA